jgi:hypothetical protein
MNMKPMKMEIDKYIYVGCIPVYAHPQRPSDQSFCIKRDCPHCKKSMWVSEKKRRIEEADPERVKVYCLECLAIGAMEQGYEPELFDIGKI